MFCFLDLYHSLDQACQTHLGQMSCIGLVHRLDQTHGLPIPPALAYLIQHRQHLPKTI